MFSFFISCSTSTNSEVNSNSISSMQRVADTLPMNSNNPYDNAGQLHDSLLQTYFSRESLPISLTGIITTATSIANENKGFQALFNGKPYKFTAADRVAYIVSHHDTCQSEIIDSVLTSNSAKSSLTDFINSLLLICETQDDYAVIYKYVVTYEDTVLRDTQLSEYDKRVMLTTSSISRYAAYARKKKPKKNTDPEWRFMVGNISAAIEGARESTEEAVMRGFVTGVVENNP